MSMVTSCPSCATTFRVTQEQLKLRRGRVRCGQCQGVFDGFKTLASLPDQPLPEAQERPTPDLPEARERSVQAMLDIESSPGVSDDRVAQPASVAAAQGGSARRRRMWIAAVFALAVVGVVQLAYALRAPLSTAVPGLRPMFERVCTWTGCVLALPKRTDTLAIEASDLQADPVRATVIVLTASLRNRGAAVVAYPALELTLTNAQDQAIARRVIQPRDYLEPPATADTGMAALAEVNVRLEFDTGDLKPAGYRLFLFYP